MTNKNQTVSGNDAVISDEEVNTAFEELSAADDEIANQAHPSCAPPIRAGAPYGSRSRPT